MTGPILNQPPGQRVVYRNEQQGIKDRDNRIAELERQVERLQVMLSRAGRPGRDLLKPGTIRRHAFNKGPGRFYVVEGVLLNEAPLDKEEAADLAARPLSVLTGLEAEPKPAEPPEAAWPTPSA